ncbi:MAG TPA: hypothetical protein IAB35_06180 [Candidatus Faecimonas gallistercoris]|nr:hypothetical protein [Candidatus Faecimonas gallistercoris]
MPVKTKKEKRKNIAVYLVLRFLVILCMVEQSLKGNWHSVALCFLTLILFTLPTIASKTFKVKLPTTLEIIVYLFIFAAEILGEIQNFYGIFKHWDTMLHTLNGFLAAAVGFSLIDILNRTERFHIKMTPVFVALVAFCFSMTIGVLWEFCEFAADRYLNLDMQKDRIVEKISSVELNEKKQNEPVVIDNINKTKIYSNDKITTIENGYLDLGLIDTMKDLIVNFIGALIFSILGFLYIKDRDEYKFIERFVPVLKKFKEE